MNNPEWNPSPVRHMEITFGNHFCACWIIISTGIFVKVAPHRKCGKTLTNIPIEMEPQSSTKKVISECRNSDFQISGFVISSLKNIQRNAQSMFYSG